MAYLSPALVTLRNEIDARWPARDRTSDGWIGDAAHAARVSDHNPEPDGSVDAIDIDADGIDVGVLLNTVVGASRVGLVIHRARWCSPATGWQWRTYTGTNPHNGHVHISCTDAGQADTSPWGLLYPTPTPSTPEEDDMPESPETASNIFEIRKYLGIMEGRIVAAIDRLTAAVKENG